MINPREHLDEINRLRFAKEAVGVHRLALKIWGAWEIGQVGDPVGLGAVCQVAFVNAMDTKVLNESPPDDPLREVAASAQLWRGRASLAATMNGEINTTAMLLAPIAMQAFAQGYPEAALAIFQEIARAGDEIERRGQQDAPGISLSVLRRASYEKQGWILWRLGRYVEARSLYEDALRHTLEASRDRVRVEAGLLLVSLGIEEHESGTFNGINALLSFRGLEARALASQWIDVAERLGTNADGVESGRITSVQGLTPMEIE